MIDNICANSTLESKHSVCLILAFDDLQRMYRFCFCFFAEQTNHVNVTMVAERWDLAQPSWLHNLFTNCKLTRRKNWRQFLRLPKVCQLLPSCSTHTSYLSLFYTSTFEAQKCIDLRQKLPPDNTAKFNTAMVWNGIATQGANWHVF